MNAQKTTSPEVQPEFGFQLIVLKSVVIFRAAIRFPINSSPLQVLHTTSLGQQELGVLPCDHIFYISFFFADIASAPELVKCWICLEILLYARSLKKTKTLLKSRWEISKLCLVHHWIAKGNIDLWISKEAVCMVQKILCSWGKMMFRIICHFSQTAELLSLALDSETWPCSIQRGTRSLQEKGFSFCCRSVVPNLNSSDRNIDEDRLHHQRRDAEK